MPVYTGGTKNTARITIFSENDCETRRLRYQPDAKTEISVVSTEFLVKLSRKVLFTFAMLNEDDITNKQINGYEKENFNRPCGAGFNDRQHLFRAGHLQNCRRCSDGTTE